MTREQLDGTRSEVAELAMEYGYRYTPRLHVDLWDTPREHERCTGASLVEVVRYSPARWERRSRRGVQSENRFDATEQS